MDEMLGERYRTRPIRFLRSASAGDWRLKVYGIAAEGDRPRPALVSAALGLADRELPPAQAAGRYGVGFVTIHDGTDADWVLLDWWANGNQLHHLAYGGDRQGELPPLTGGLAGCTWELAVTEFERQAWLREVYSAPDPSLDRYLAARLEADV